MLIRNGNKDIARFGAEDMQYRINAMTGQGNRFSYAQIKAACIYHASGWPMSKIFDSLQQIEAKKSVLISSNNYYTEKPILQYRMCYYKDNNLVEGINGACMVK